MCLSLAALQRSNPMSQPIANNSEGNFSLADALFTATQQRVFSIVFGQSERSFYLTEIVRLADIGRGAVQRELQRLERSGLVTVFRIGNQKHYQANADSPLFTELTSIVKKTVGLKQPILDALLPIENKINLAFVYGSIAKSNDSAGSDIDIMIVSDELTLEDLFNALSPLEISLGRKINPTLYKTSEFNKKRLSKKGFLGTVLTSPVIELIGRLNE